jgi:hypothetical protein
MPEQETAKQSPRQPVRRTIMWAPTVIMYLAMAVFPVLWLTSSGERRADWNLLASAICFYSVPISGFAMLSMKRPLSWSDKMCGWLDLVGIAFAMLVASLSGPNVIS